MAAAGCSGRRQFAAACAVLSRCVKAEAAAGNKMAAAATVRAASPAQAASTMLLTPGADVAPHDVVEETEVAPSQSSQARLTIAYAGRVLVFDGFPADTTGELLRVAAAARPDSPGRSGTADAPVARKASLQRFMEKRRDRLAAQAPYAAARQASPAFEKRNEEGAQGAGCWLGLGVPGGGRAC